MFSAVAFTEKCGSLSLSLRGAGLMDAKSILVGLVAIQLRVECVFSTVWGQCSVLCELGDEQSSVESMM